MIWFAGWQATPASSGQGLRRVPSNECSRRNGPVLVVAGPSGIDRVSRGKLRVLHPSSDGEYAYELSASCDGRTAVYEQSDGESAGCNSVAVITVKTGAVHELATHIKCASAPTFLDNGNILFTGSGGHRSSTYEIAPDGSHLVKRFDHGVVAASRDGESYLGADIGSRRLVLYNRNGVLVRPITPQLPHGSEYLNAKISPNGESAYFVEDRFESPRHTFFLYRVGLHTPALPQLIAKSGTSCEPAMSPDEKWIACISAGDDYYGGQEIIALSVRRPKFKKVLASSPRGEYLYDPAWGGL